MFPAHTTNTCTLNKTLKPIPTSTGDQRAKSQPLKIKDNVVHAGPSPPPVLWNQLMPSSDLVWEASLNNNWLTAHLITEIWDATEV